MKEDKTGTDGHVYMPVDRRHSDRPSKDHGDGGTFVQAQPEGMRPADAHRSSPRGTMRRTYTIMKSANRVKTGLLANPKALKPRDIS